MDKLIFMSPAHIEALNERVNQSGAVRAACARLPREIRVAYHLHDEDGGPDVWWLLTCSRTVGGGPEDRCRLPAEGPGRPSALSVAVDVHTV